VQDAAVCVHALTPRGPQAEAARAAGGWFRWQEARRVAALQRLVFAACFTVLAPPEITRSQSHGLTPTQILFDYVLLVGRGPWTRVTTGHPWMLVVRARRGLIASHSRPQTDGGYGEVWRSAALLGPAAVAAVAERAVAQGWRWRLAQDVAVAHPVAGGEYYYEGDYYYDAICDVQHSVSQ
jgi:hypothetical protein